MKIKEKIRNYIKKKFNLAEPHPITDLEPPRYIRVTEKKDFLRYAACHIVTMEEHNQIPSNMLDNYIKDRLSNKLAKFLVDNAIISKEYISKDPETGLRREGYNYRIDISCFFT